MKTQTQHWLKSCSNDAEFTHVNATDNQVILGFGAFSVGMEMVA